ncbi:hypothetical protein AWM75_08140 [Aerococcus urinaehominis]|uniref:AB hydrolase-1 domain-containing protein n=2 Tax=Aerococcus urinaehominis TaxID=128944 RepID=A0A109RGW2_9LACT|nr:hypothetical protein AWM75_08140 [Aerococcus urinaehominis]SDM42577.1 hypothetical protein SAMN04487985_11611 [Aerococcus urinaehominis]
MKKLLRGLGIFLVAFILVGALGLTLYVGNQVFQGATKLVDRQETLANEKRYDQAYNNILVPLGVEEITIPGGQHDQDIPAIYIANNQATGVVVLLHGLGGTKKTLVQQMKTFYDLGYSVLAYDQANSGGNQAPYNTYGVLESQDCLAVLDYVHSQYAPAQTILWGESFGGATATMAAGQAGDQLDYLILDCPMSDGFQMIEKVFQQIEDQTGLPTAFLTFAGNIMMRAKLGTSFAELASQPYAAKIQVPVLITVGADDEVLRPTMSQDIYDSISHDKKELVKLPGYGHCEFPIRQPDQYQDLIATFLNDY